MNLFMQLVLLHKISISSIVIMKRVIIIFVFLKYENINSYLSAFIATD